MNQIHRLFKLFDNPKLIDAALILYILFITGVYKFVRIQMEM